MSKTKTILQADLDVLQEFLDDERGETYAHERMALRNLLDAIAFADRVRGDMQ